MLLLSSCSNLLPSIKQTTESPWKDYESAHQTFNKILPGSTRIEELKALGLDPFGHPNIKLLNYLDVMRHFLPNESVRLTDLPPDIQVCLQAKTDCHGYEITSGNVYSERQGNAFLDIFNFRRNTQTSGWQFLGFIVLNKDIVAYKLESGRPNILEHEEKRNPLGPIQDITIPSQLPISY